MGVGGGGDGGQPDKKPKQADTTRNVKHNEEKKRHDAGMIAITGTERRDWTASGARADGKREREGAKPRQEMKWLIINNARNNQNCLMCVG
jgi:hypothetical protein